MTIEEKLNKLKNIVSEMENNSLSIEDNIELYKNGKILIKEINDEIKNASLKVEEIKGENQI